MHSALRIVFLLVALTGLLPAHADEIYTIDLHHRRAEEIMPVIRPLLSPQDALSGRGDVLILRSSDATYQRVLSLVNKLDSKVQSLIVSVSRLSDIQRQRQAIGAQGNIELGPDANVRIGERDEPGVQIQAGASRHRQSETGEQTVRVIEGQPAFIAIGQTVPYTQYSYGQQTVTERPVNRGFSVVAHVHGQQVQVAISPIHERLQRGGTIAHESAQTVVSGRLGEWIPIAGSSESTSNSSRGTLSAGSSSGNQLLDYAVKVEVAH
jgi:hypothetical protein